MDRPMTGEASETAGLLRRAAQGDQEAWGTLLLRSRDRLRRMVALRLDRRLQGRVDPSDIIQEACIDASARLAEYARQPDMPFFLWLRFLTGQRLVRVHRQHLGAEMRDVAREVSLYRGALPAATSAAIAAQLLRRDTRPSEAAVRAGRGNRLQGARDSKGPLDPEGPARPPFEQFSNAEAARVLGLQEPAAAKRYVRVLKRLRLILDARPGGLGGL